MDPQDSLALQVLLSLCGLAIMLGGLLMLGILFRGLLLRARASMLMRALHAREEMALVQHERDACASMLAAFQSKDELDRVVLGRWLRRCGMLTKIGISKRREAETFERAAARIGWLLGDWARD